jgi:NADH-quinone oxidoreductase subunit N
MLSLAGIPPLPGFFAKLFIFKSVVASGHLLAAIVAFVGSFIGVTYYLALFFRPFTTETMAEEPAAEAEWEQSAAGMADDPRA